MSWTPVSALISVDFPAPFSPIRAWISPGSKRKSTPSSAFTPGKSMVTPFMATTGAWALPDTGVVMATSFGTRSRASSSVLAVRQSSGGLLLVEGLILGDDPRRHRLSRDNLLGEVHQLRAEQRIAFDDEVEL